MVERAAHLRPAATIGTPPAPPPPPAVPPAMPGRPAHVAGGPPAAPYQPAGVASAEPDPTQLAWWLARANRVALLTGVLSAVTVLVLAAVTVVSIKARIDAENSATAIADTVAAAKSDNAYTHSQLRQAQSDIAARRETAGYISMYIANIGPVDSDLVSAITSCGAGDQACKNAVTKMGADFKIFEVSRSAVKAPPSLAGADGNLKKGIADSIKACSDMAAAVDSGSGSQFGAGFNELQAAYNEIQAADTQMSNQLKQEGTATAPL